MVAKGKAWLHSPLLADVTLDNFAFHDMSYVSGSMQLAIGILIGNTENSKYGAKPTYPNNDGAGLPISAIRKCRSVRHGYTCDVFIRLRPCRL